MANAALQLWHLLTAIWHATPSPVRTVLLTVVGILIGAWLASRAQSKRRVIDELKAIRAARALCFTVSNKALALKRQHVRSMKQRYDAAVDKYDAFQANPVSTLDLALDLQTLSQIKFPTDVLERIAFEKCSLETEALALIVALSGAADDLRNSINFRNDLVVEFREKQPMNEGEKIELYVGAYRSGMVDSRFGDNVQALEHQTDDCIFFSMRLENKLLINGNSLRRRNCWQFRLGVPKLLPADWTIAREANLIPPDSQYAQWMRGFRARPSKWERLLTWMKSLLDKSP